MNTAEKAAVDLPVNKAAKKRAVLIKTQQLLAGGFAYDNAVFPSDQASREFFMTKYKLAQAGAQAFPVYLPTANDGVYTVADQAAFDALHDAAVLWGVGIKDTETTLLKDIADAADQAALDAVVDNR